MNLTLVPNLTNMISYITEAILIEKHYLISVFDGVVIPRNVLISSMAVPVRMKFAWRRCAWYFTLLSKSNGELTNNVIDFAFPKSDISVKKWFIDNQQKEFVAFVRLRNGLTYIIGNNNVGLSIVFQHQLNIANSFAVFFTGITDKQPVSSSYPISDFFVGRDFSDDFNIDFG